MEKKLKKLRAEKTFDEEVWVLIQHVRDPTKAAEDFQAGFSEAQAVVERGNTLLTSLAHNPDSLKLLFVVAAVAFLLILLFGWMLSKLDPWFAQNAAIFTTVAGFLTSSAYWVKKQAAWWSDRLAQVERVKKAIDIRISNRQAEIQRQIAELEKQLELKKETFVAKEQARNEAQRRVDEIKVQIAEATPQKMLEKFIQERTESNDYRKHLGLLALIRQDFQNLSELIELDNKKLEDDPEAIKKEEAGDEQRINRIVLYIDDLDRCPTDKVVQVLQAVHLLLAFPLFVVVVAVDARWISSSLASKYGSLLGGSKARWGRLLSSTTYGSATPLDYIEKIFQIPFWLRPTDEKGRHSLIHGLLKGNITVQTAAEATSVTSPQPVSPEKPATPEIGGQKGVRTPIQGSDFVDQGGKTGLDKTPTGGGVTVTPVVEAKDGDREAETDPNPEGLSIPQTEVDYLERLIPLLGRSPRAIKRFVNIYRLIRVSLSGDELSRFTVGEYKIAMFLLAVVTNLPAASELIFCALEEPALSTLQNWDSLIERLNSQTGAERNEEWQQVHAWLQQTGGLRELPFELERVQLWAKRIGRFSFFIEPGWLD